MATKKPNYTEHESGFLDQKLKEIEEYLQGVNIGKLKDRVIKLNGKEVLAEKKEKQRSDYFAALKEFAELTKVVRDTRIIEDSKREVRGDQNLTPIEDGTI